LSPNLCGAGLAERYVLRSIYYLGYTLIIPIEVPALAATGLELEAGIGFGEIDILLPPCLRYCCLKEY